MTESFRLELRRVMEKKNLNYADKIFDRRKTRGNMTRFKKKETHH